MRALDLADVLLVLGAVVLVIGVALVHVPAAIIVGGLELLGAGILLVRRPHGSTG
jgi:hypothetical protein